MTGRTNAVVGTGSSTTFAFIKVTYPSGSSCTCEKNGGQTFYAPDSSGTWVISIPEAGTWTVKSSDNNNNASKDIVISELGQVETVMLSYRLYLFDENGYAAYTSGTGGWSWELGSGYADNGVGTYSSNKAGWVAGEGLCVSHAATAGWGSASAHPRYICTKNAIDLSNFAALYVYVSAYKNVSSTSPNLSFGFASTYQASDFTGSTIVVKAADVDTVKTLDLSSVNSSLYFTTKAYNAAAMFKYAYLE